jgi:hypothetical protein
MNIRQFGRTCLAILLVGVGLVALPTACSAATTAGASNANPTDRTSEAVLGSWRVIVHVDGQSVPIDTLYSFAQGGVFCRVDGRNNAPALGTWKRDGDSIIFSFDLYAFDTGGHRVGTILTNSKGRVVKGKLSGSFVSTEVDPNGNPIVEFHRSGTVEGARIEPKGP